VLGAGTKWLAGAIGAGIIGYLVTVPLASLFDSDGAQPPQPPRRTVTTAQPIFDPVRPVYWCQQPRACYGPSRPTINSFINMPNYGDERSFFDAKNNLRNSDGGFRNNLVVYDGETVRLRIYYANSASPASRRVRKFCGLCEGGWRGLAKEGVWRGPVFS
jgi:hypothetical protein